MQGELNRDIYNECQVVYILSRIRKYLESTNKKREYKFLNFYCNWALHAKIDRSEPIGDVLRAFINQPDDDKFMNFEYLHEELKKFLSALGLNATHFFERDNYLRFMNLLVDIYSDTPVEVYPDQKRVITITRAESAKKPENTVFAVQYKIT